MYPPSAQADSESLVYSTTQKRETPYDSYETNVPIYRRSKKQDPRPLHFYPRVFSRRHTSNLNLHFLTETKKPRGTTVQIGPSNRHLLAVSRGHLA